MSEATKSLVINRKIVDRLLHLSKSLSYRMFAPTKIRGVVRYGDVVSALCDAMRNGNDRPTTIPDDLLTPSELAKQMGVPVRRVWRRLKVRKGGVRHYRFSRRNVLVSASDFISSVS